MRKAFKNIFQEERILEESKKELQSCNSKVAKLQKQVSRIIEQRRLSQIRSSIPRPSAWHLPFTDNNTYVVLCVQAGTGVISPRFRIGHGRLIF